MRNLDCPEGHGLLKAEVIGQESVRYGCPFCGYFVNVERTDEVYRPERGISAVVSEAVTILDRMGF